MDRGFVKTSTGYVHYRAICHCKSMILMHAVPRSSTMFFELMERLGKELCTFAVDIPGYGMSDHIAGKPTIADYAKMMHEVTERLGVSRPSLLGEASGAYIAIEMANNYAEEIEKIVLINCPFYPNREFSSRRHSDEKKLYRADATGFPLPRTLEEALEKDPDHSPMHGSQSWIDRDNVALIEAGRNAWQLMDALREYDLASNLERLQCPVLLIWGENFYGLRFQEEFISRIRKQKAVVIPGGRFLISIDHADQVSKEILDFMR